MDQKNKSTLEYIMHYGALLGFFLVFRYLFKIGESYWVHFIYFYGLLYFVPPILMYIFYMRYKMQTPEVKHTIWNCILFVVGINFFGSFFEAAIMYAHFTFINPDVFANISAEVMGIVEAMQKAMEESGAMKNMSEADIENMKSQMEAVGTSKALFITGNTINHLFSGFLFSLIIGLLTRNKTINLNN